ncbi:CU044_5270 family protein [Actinoplanes sp. NPDC051861]|uniref:CU044_5270 family protein n=1 Tax=Actinoplanes sp. NPDC051861 TaxID=3155170 RepID=UPI00342EEAF0
MSDLTTAAPTGPDLPEARRRALRAHLMAELHTPARRHRMMIALPVAGVLAAVTAAGMIAGPWDDGVRPIPTTQILAGDHAAAVVFLDRLALSAGARENGPTDGRYLYVKSRVAWMRFTELDDGKLDELHQREVWLPLFAGGRGLLKEPDRPSDLGVFTAERLQQDLPDEPGALLKWIYKSSQGQGNTPDGQAFSVIGDLLRESMLPARTNAALYQAAAKIPGVELVEDSVDAVGRHGIAVAHVELGERREWIFDEKTGEYLGERSYLVEDRPWGRAGMITATTAVTERAVVTRLGARP